MAEEGATNQLSRLSIQLSAVFAVVGVGLLYLYIAVSDATDQTKVLQAGGLSLVVAFVFLIMWALMRDFAEQTEPAPEKRRRA